MNKTTIKIILLVAGSYSAFIVGASFATGQKILQYFAAHGMLGLVGALVSLITFSLTDYYLLDWGQKNINSDDASIVS